MLKNWHFYKGCISSCDSDFSRKMRRVEAFISNLDDLDKKIITMRYFECCSMSIVAERLSMHRVSLHRKLKKVLNKLQFVCETAN